MTDSLPVSIDKRFFSALDLSKHPMKNAKAKVQEDYFQVLSYIVREVNLNEITKYRLFQYGNMLVGLSQQDGNKDIAKAISSIVTCRFQFWRDKYRYWLLVDIALILQHTDDIESAYHLIQQYVPVKKLATFQLLYQSLADENVDITAISFVEQLIFQYRANKRHENKKQMKIIITANMSAGKSTFINALIGKSLARASQEVCTGNITYICNKPFEDGGINLFTDCIKMDAIERELSSFLWDKPAVISTCFANKVANEYQCCIVDTPGVNSAIKREHGRITKDILRVDDYDKVVYILNANKLGTEEELSYLNWVVQNVKNDKIIFILNKMDTFNFADDNIDESIQGIKDDLIGLGFDSPVVYPISSYFALLIKIKQCGGIFSEDEQDEYEYYTKKFSRIEYDLSRYYKNVCVETTDPVEIAMSKRCGLFGVERVIFGGNNE